ncbi:MAG: hypothetical protein ACRDE7_04525 [Sphingobacterium sp.]
MKTNLKNLSFIKSSLLFLTLAIITIGCTKEDNGEVGYYSINTLTNSLDMPVTVEIGRVTKKISSLDVDYMKNLVYMPLAKLESKQTLIVDSTFTCTNNCESVLNERDPEFAPIFIKISLDKRVKIDTNASHIYVTGGLIKKHQTEEKNYFNHKYHTLTKDESGNIINSYTFNKEDLEKAK